MTRQDYVAVAAVIREHVEGTAPMPPEMPVTESIARRLADVFKDDNIRFNRARFYTACGLEGWNE